MAAKKKTKTKAKAKAKAKAPPRRRATVKHDAEPKGKSHREFMNTMFADVERTLPRVQDPERRKDLTTRFTALRSKLRALKTEKLTAERAGRYGEELQKVAADIISACCT